jgi:hypothetical protein
MKIGYAAKIPFSPAESQETGLQAAGIEKVWMEGRGAETLASCLVAFRERPGDLHVFGGLRVLAGSRDGIVKAVRDLKHRKIVVVDEMNKERSDQHGAEMLDRAMRQILGSNKVKGSSKFARKIGAQGGDAKAESAKAKRDAILREDIIRRIVNAPELTWERKVEILGEPFNESTLRRHYYVKD